MSDPSGVNPYKRWVFDPTPCDTRIANLYSTQHQILNHYSSEAWRERVGAELTFHKKLESDKDLARQQKINDRARISPEKSSKRRSQSVMEMRKTKGLPPVYREKPLVPYRPNSLRSLAPRNFDGERNFKKTANFRNVSQFSFSGMDGHSFVNNPRLRFSTTAGIGHSTEAVKKIGTENPSITSQLVKLIHNKTFK